MDVVIGLGSNLGDREAALRFAVSGLGAASRVTAVSALYETASFGVEGPAFLNAAVRADWDAAPRDVLRVLLALEQRRGRLRREKWGPRTLDLDLLWIRDRVVAEPDLAVPHTHLRERRFALEPLLEVAPEARDPVTGVALSAWLAELPPAGVRRASAADWAGSFTPAK